MAVTHPPDRSTEIFGLAVHQLRRLQGMTLAEFGERSGLSAATLEELERGDRLPDLEEVVALGAGLGMTASAIMRVWETGEREGDKA